MKDIYEMSQDEVYNAVAKKRITASTPREKADRSFGANAQAYKWTNESLVELATHLNLDLQGRDMLLIACSGDPVITFAGLGAGNQVAFDSSHKAVLWSELKLNAVKKFSWNEFCSFFGLENGLCSDAKPSYRELREHLSEYAREVFDGLFMGNSCAHEIFSKASFFRQGGYSNAFPTLNNYSASEENYEKARQQLKRHIVRLVPGSLEDVLKLAGRKFGAFYGSNAMDHFTNSSGQFDYSKGNIKPFLEAIDSKLDGDAKMVLQFEWSQELLENATEVLAEKGYSADLAPGKAGGYGKLCVASRKKQCASNQECACCK